MPTHARTSRGNRTPAALKEDHGREDVFELIISEDDADPGQDDDDSGDVCRVRCPDCARPIALRAGDESLPQHAVCPTPWNPFGLTVCPGSGRAAEDAVPADQPPADDGQEWGALLALPAGLNWRTQPFSHVGGPGSRPIRAA